MERQQTGLKKCPDKPVYFAELHSGKPAEPLDPFEEMTLNSGGFFLPRFLSFAASRLCVRLLLS